jgi:shikimate dehydrogenase
MNLMPPMPDAVLEALAGAAASGIVFDMVYAPLETGLLRRANSLSLATVTGLTMLIGQARAAFRLFFGAEAPADDSALMARLTR